MKPIFKKSTTWSIRGESWMPKALEVLVQALRNEQFVLQLRREAHHVI
jgi:hypothetical protein